jgi:hypothetical protein
MIGGFAFNRVEAEFAFWHKMDVDFMMLAVAYDFFFDDKNIECIERLKNKYQLDILLHARPDGHLFYSPADPGMHDDIFKSLHIIQALIGQGMLIDKVILHLTTCHIPGTSFPVFTEEAAIKNSQPFFKELRHFHQIRFVFENIYPPDFGWSEIGYRFEHFDYFDIDETSEFCFDTGHYKLSPMNQKDILNMPFDLTCLHLHSNNGQQDAHMLCTRQNFSEWEFVEGLLSDDKYIVLELKSELKPVRKYVERLRRGKISEI